MSAALWVVGLVVAVAVVAMLLNWPHGNVHNTAAHAGRDTWFMVAAVVAMIFGVVWIALAIAHWGFKGT